MKVNFLKRTKPLLLGLVMAMGSVIPISGTQEGIITGENEVNNIILSAIVPSDLNFTLDPIGLESIEGSQIANGNYFFLNKTTVPIKVSIEITAVLVDGATLVDDPQELARDDVTVVEKKIYFGILGASSLDTSDLSFDNITKEDIKGIYNPGSDAFIPFDAQSRTARIEFILEPAYQAHTGEGEGEDGGSEYDDTADTLADGNKGIGVFQFYAELNTYAEWESGDIKLVARYTVAPLRRTTYERYLHDDPFVSSGWGTQLKQ